jgi:hypothetical protein
MVIVVYNEASSPPIMLKDKSVVESPELDRIRRDFPDLSIGGGTDEAALKELEIKYRLQLQLADNAMKERELRLKEESSRAGRWTNPLTVGVLVAAVGLVGNFVNGLWANLNQGAQLESQQKLENVRLQNDLIKEAIKSPTEIARAKSLVFFANNRLIFLDDKVVQSLRKVAGNDQPVPGSTSVPYTPVAGSIIATPDTINPGGVAYLKWNSFNATKVSITPDIGPVPLQGSLTVSPKATTVYTLTIENEQGGLGSGSAAVYVRH